MQTRVEAPPSPVCVLPPLAPAVPVLPAAEVPALPPEELVLAPPALLAETPPPVDTPPPSLLEVPAAPADDDGLLDDVPDDPPDDEPLPATPPEPPTTELSDPLVRVQAASSKYRARADLEDNSMPILWHTTRKHRHGSTRLARHGLRYSHGQRAPPLSRTRPSSRWLFTRPNVPGEQRSEVLACLGDGESGSAPLR